MSLSGNLPEPPTDAEKYLYTDPAKGKFLAVAIPSTASLLAGMFFFATSSPWFLFYILFAVYVGVYAFISFFVMIFGGRFDLAHHQRIKAKYFLEAHPDEHLSVDVYLPCCGEPLDVLENTYKHVAKLRWPRLAVFVLDDKGLPEVRNLAEKYGFSYISRPNKGELKKAGNIRHAFAHTAGEVIAILDADFCPRPDYLEETLPYFLWDRTTAIVQTPQYFTVEEGQTDIQKGAAAQQEIFYRTIQPSRNLWNGSICVGTCALYRREALEPLGGTYPIEHSEDVFTGFEMVKNGWRLHYVPLVLSKGLCPDEIKPFFNQQYRWCSGSTNLLMGAKKDFFWGTKMPWQRRLCYLSGMLYYSATAIGIFLAPLPSLLMVWFAPQHVFWWNICASIPSLFTGHVWMRMWAKGKYGFYCHKTTLIAAYAHLFAIKDRLMRRVEGWVPTGEGGKKEKT